MAIAMEHWIGMGKHSIERRVKALSLDFFAFFIAWSVSHQHFVGLIELYIFYN